MMQDSIEETNKKIEADRKSLDELCEQNEFVLFDNSALLRRFDEDLSKPDSVLLQFRWIYLLGSKIKDSPSIYIPKRIFGEYIDGIMRGKIYSDIKIGMEVFANIIEQQKRIISSTDVEKYSEQFQNMKRLRKECGLSKNDYELLIIGTILSKDFPSAIVTNDQGIITAYSLIQRDYPELSIWSRLYGTDTMNALHKVEDQTLRSLRRRITDKITEPEKKRILKRAGFSYENYQQK